MHRLLLSAIFLVVCAFGQAVDAQDKSGLKVGVVAVQRAFAESAEGREVTARTDALERDFKNQVQQKSKDLKDLETTFQQTLRVGTPQYEEKRKEWINKSVEAKLWAEVTQQEMQRTRVQNLKHFVEKLDVAVAEVAAKRGLDLILPDMRQPFTESSDNAQDIQRVVNSRNVLFAHPSIDVTTDVIAAWDAKFREKK